MNGLRGFSYAWVACRSSNRLLPFARPVIRLPDSPASFAQHLNALRRRKRFSLRALALAAGLSTTYVRTLEKGSDPRTGKAIRPSVDVIRRLAGALGEGLEVEAKRIFAEFMNSAGYLPSGVAERAAPYGEQERPTTIDGIIDSIRRTQELSEEDKRAFIRLIERSRRIVRGESDPDPHEE